MALPSTSFADLAASNAPPSASQIAMTSAITPTFSNTTSTVTNAAEMSNLDSMATANPGGIVSGVGNLATEAVGGVGNILSGAVGALGGGVTGALSAVTSLASGDISGFASQISKAAGNLNDLLSLKRGANLPSGAELFAEKRATVLVSPGTENDWRVRIDAPWEQFNSPLFSKHLENTGGVVWPYLPNLTIATKANYTNPDVTHSNYAIQAYKNSQVEDIQISGEFTCETETDGLYWLAATTFFKTATKMFFAEQCLCANPSLSDTLRVCHRLL